MKFGKGFASQMVPEWHEAYINYNELKRLLKKILSVRQNKPLPSHQAVTKTKTLPKTFSGLHSRYHRKSSISRHEEEVIVVSEKEDEDGNYHTTFLMVSDESGQLEHTFFEKLDRDFNKVIKFYRSKEEEMIKEADKMTMQMDALVALRLKVDKHYRKDAVVPDDAMSTIPEDGEEEEESGEKTPRKENAKTLVRGPTTVLGNVEISVEPETPASTLRSILNIASDDSLFTKKSLIKVEQRMRVALSEFYQKLRYLKSYCFLNQLALSKILKKYDKVTSRSASKAYLEMVDKSYLGRSDKVTGLMERVEATFIKHFTHGNRRKGMSHLRLKTKKEKHLVTYFIGFFSGCSLALIMSIILIVHARDIFQSEGRERYMENIFPLYSLFGYIALHMVIFSGNIYYWKRFRVNYPFIFGFKTGTEMSHGEVLLVSTGIAVLTMASVLSNLEMDMDPETRSIHSLELVPLGLLTVLILITFCPFNIIYRESRFFFLGCVWRCLCAPLYKVTLPDFFLADQLTSQVQAIRSLLFYGCYYGTGDYKTRATSTCHQSSIYHAFYLIVALIPYWSRCLQCARRLVEEGDSAHIVNGFKYLSTIIAVIMRTVYDRNKGLQWKLIAAFTSCIATVYSTYWDVIKDWGLLQTNSKNPWLRDKLLVPYKSVYFIAMIVNVILRLAWMQSVLDLNEAPFLHKRALLSVVAGAEIFRRGIWNFFRLENEHLNNVGKYRAFKSVPLPFNFKG